MADERRVHVDVAIDLATETIQGTLDDGTGPVVGFTGWLELMSAFDTVRARAQTPPSGRETRSP